ncbi:MAG: hypothetical protein HYS89_01100 [Candidatus Colwellbacteria bacterium]|nr:hypothetical protein [Candidatus Colwellbacteria bacterium]
MKIVSHGAGAKRFSCPHCHTSFEADLSEDVHYSADVSWGGREMDEEYRSNERYFVRCPVCDTQIGVDHSTDYIKKRAQERWR